MSQGGEERAAFRQKPAELVMAAIFLALGAIVIYDSVDLGARWGDDGPQAGYFPFYIALLVCISALVNFISALTGERERIFVDRDKLRLVLAVLVPAAIYVGVIG